MSFVQIMLTATAVLLAISKIAFAYKNELVLCEGMYGGNSIPFAIHSSEIKVKIVPASLKGSLSLAIYAFEDKNLFENGPQAYPICYSEQVSQKKCDANDMNKFIIANTSTSFPSTPVLNEGVHWHGNSFNTSQSLKSQSIHDISDSTSLSFTYNVSQTGYYCVLAIPDPDHSLPFQDYSIQMYVQNPYGALPAVFYPALPFFATQLAAYLLVGSIWGFVSYVNRKELLRMQNLIGMMMVFLILENCVNLSFFVDFNNHGHICNRLVVLF